jgi:alpha-1,2-mannosyltransferase
VLKGLDRRLYFYVATGLAVFALCYLSLRPWNLSEGYMIGAPFGRDFVNFWLGGHLAWSGNLHPLFDLGAYNDTVATRFHHNHDDKFVFSYPPLILPFLAPFGLLPYVPALFIWTGFNLVCLAVATRMLRGRIALASAACLSPAALVMVLYGHFGGMLALAAIVCLIHGKDRPWVAGACLGLLSVKPQFAVMIGLFLLIRGAWQTIIIGIAVCVGLALISIALFGLQPWQSFLHWTIPLQERLLRNIAAQGASTTISLYTGLRIAGVAPVIAQGLQYLLALLLIGGAAFLLRTRHLSPPILAIALLTTLLALPYSNHYDLAIAAPALTVAFFDSDMPQQDRIPLSPITLLLWLMPILTMVSLIWLNSLPIVNVAAPVCLVLLMIQSFRAGDGIYTQQ